MAAHLRTIHKAICEKPLCTRVATQALHNARNEPIADYCGAHAADALRRFQEQEGA